MCGRSLRPKPDSGGPDWEFWGNPKALEAIGIGLLVAVVGIVLGFYLHPLFLFVAFAGLAVIGGALGYLVYFENWDLLQRRKEQEELTTGARLPQETDEMQYHR